MVSRGEVPVEKDAHTPRFFLSSRGGRLRNTKKRTRLGAVSRQGGRNFIERLSSKCSLLNRKSWLQ